MIKDKLINSKKGITFIEILLSIVLLAVIVTPFLGMYTQAAKSSGNSKDILDATYMAQKNMEQTYAISQSENFQNGLDILEADGFSKTQITPDKEDYKFTKTIDSYDVSIEIYTDGYTDDLVKVLIKIYNGTKLEVQMETILLWEHTGV